MHWAAYEGFLDTVAILMPTNKAVVEMQDTVC